MLFRKDSLSASCKNQMFSRLTVVDENQMMEEIDQYQADDEAK